MITIDMMEILLVVTVLWTENGKLFNNYTAIKPVIQQQYEPQFSPFIYDSGGSCRGSRWNPLMHKLKIENNILLF